MAHGLISRDTIYAKVESTYGTDSVPVGSDAVLVRSVSHAMNPRMIPRPAVTGSLSGPQQAYGGALETIEILADLRGSGTAGTAPEISPLLLACGLSETVVASTSVTYAPQAATIQSCTIYYFESVDGGSSRVRRILTGCRGTFTIDANSGENGLIRFVMTGKRSAPTDQTPLTPTYDATVPQGIRGLSSLVLGGVANLVVQGFTFDAGNDVQTPDNVLDAEGYGNVTIVTRDPTLTLRRHAELLATINPFADIVAGTTRAFDSGTVGSVAGNRWRLQASTCAYRGIQSGEVNGMRTREAVFGCHASALGGDNNFSLAFL